MDSRYETYLNFSFPVERSLQRFRELIIYVSKKCETDTYFGAVKLNKILYYSDFMAFYRFGTPLTGLSYFRIKAGPAPKAMRRVEDDLAKEGAVRFEKVELEGKTQIRTIALREAVLSHFSRDELLLVDEIIETLWSQTATQVSNASHDIKWKVLQDKDLLPYEFAFLDGEITEEDKQRTLDLAKEHGW